MREEFLSEAETCKHICQPPPRLTEGTIDQYGASSSFRWATTTINLLFSLLTVCTGYVCVTIIHRTLTRTTGSLSCAQMLIKRLHTGVYEHRKRVCTESWLWEKNPLPHRGIEPASAAWRSDALPNWATSHLIFGTRNLNFCVRSTQCGGWWTHCWSWLQESRQKAISCRKMVKHFGSFTCYTCNTLPTVCCEQWVCFLGFCGTFSWWECFLLCDMPVDSERIP